MRFVHLVSAWLCIAVTSAAASGKPVKGVVKDAQTDSCIAYANVMAYALPDSMLLGFAVTDEAGMFSLDALVFDRLLLKVSCLGYKAAEVEVSSTHDGVCITMQPDEMMLKNVVVKGRMSGIKVRGDTIDYHFQNYTDGSEKVLKDILKKLPGMDVDDKGRVTANGEAVKKILVNGQDFFGDHDEQIANNLPSDYVDKIQLRKNYSEYSFLEGFKTRKSTALNVTIDSLHSGNVTGNAELLGGYRDKYRVAVNLFSFGDKVMWGANAKVFNTGEEMMTLEDYIKLLGGVKDYAQAFVGPDKTIDNGLSPVSYISNSINTCQRTNGVASANVAWNPKEHVKVNAYYLFNHEQSKGNYDINRAYLGRDVAERMRRTTDTRHGFHHLGFNIKNSLRGNAAIDWKLTASAMPQKSRNNLGVYSWDENTDVWNLSSHLAFAKNWNNQNLLSVSSQLVYNNCHRSIDVESVDSLLYMQEWQIYSATQDQRTTLLDHFLTASWVHRLTKAWQFKMSTAWNLIRSAMTISPSAIDFVQVRNDSARPEQARLSHPASSFLPVTERDEETTHLYGYGLSIQKKKGLFRLDAGCDMVYVRQSHSTDKIAILPNASIELALSSINTLTLSYSSGFERDDSYFAHGTVLNDYRQLTILDGRSDLLHKQHTLSFSSHYFNILSDFTWITSLGCSFTENPYFFSYESHGNTTIASLMQSKRNQVSQHAYINIKKGFAFPLVLSLKTTLVNSLYQTAYSREISNNRHSHAEGDVSLTSKYKTSLLNGEVGFRFRFQQSKLGLTSTQLNLMSYEAYVRPFLVKKGKWDVSLPMTYIHDQSGARRFGYFDIGVQASYKKGRWSFFADGKNLLNTKRFERISVSAEKDYSETIVESRLPGYIVIGLKKMF